MPGQKILEIKNLKTTFHANGQAIRAVGSGPWMALISTF